MQHPKRSCESAKSYAAHLTGLCCGVEYNRAQAIYAALQRWLNGPAEAIGITRPTEPDCRGALTVRYVYDARTEAETSARVQEWAKDVWTAYSSQHRIATDWIRGALGEFHWTGTLCSSVTADSSTLTGITADSKVDGGTHEESSAAPRCEAQCGEH